MPKPNHLFASKLLDDDLDSSVDRTAALAHAGIAKNHRNFGFVRVSAYVAAHCLSLGCNFLLVDVARRIYQFGRPRRELGFRRGHIQAKECNSRAQNQAEQSLDRHVEYE
jgi:hypothetical protein